jgi:hypothetical protein
MKLALLALVAGAWAQGGKGKAGPAPTPKLAAKAPTPKILTSDLSQEEEKKKILAEQVQNVLENEAADNNGKLQGTIVDLVLQSMSMNFTAVCNLSSKDFKTCAEGYNSGDCVFEKEAASFGNVNCIPYLTQCADALLQYCRSKVPNNEKCKSTNACDCANEAGCGWSRGHMMCLTGRPLVSCGDCSSMPRCGAIDCTKATRPCDCVALGGMCGWSTSSWRCESGKDTDCNECPEQSECGGPGITLADSASCPVKKPAQLSSCSTVATCPYDKKCCERCAGAKQVCTATRATCDGKYWEITTADLSCPSCEGYYYDDGYYEDDAPSTPQGLATSGLTASSVTLTWTAPEQHFIVGTDGYSVAYAETKKEDDLSILNITTLTRVVLNNLKPNTEYKVSILPVTLDEVVGEPAHLTFRTPALASATAAKAKRKGAPKAAKVMPKVAKKAPAPKGKN